MNFSVEVSESGHVTSICLAGEVDAYTTPAFAQAVKTSLQRGAAHFVIDLEGVTYIDSSGLGVLISTLKALSARHGTLGIVAAQDEVRRLFAITGLDRVLTLHDNRSDALQAARRVSLRAYRGAAQSVGAAPNAR